MIGLRGLAAGCYRLGLAAAKRRDLSAALRYAEFACLFAAASGDTEPVAEQDTAHPAVHLEDVSHFAAICRYELGETDEDPALEAVGLLARRKQWKAAALAARRIPHQRVRLLNMQGCLWALAKRDERAADCFARALAKDRGNRLAAEALACLTRRRKRFWRFF